MSNGTGGEQRGGADAGEGPLRRTRRALVGHAAALGATGALAACGAPGGQAPESPESATRQPVKLDYWSWFGPQSLTEQQPMFDAFKTQAPHVTVDWTGVGSAEFLAKVTAAVASGTPPDMAYLDNQHQGFFGRQKLLVDQGPLGKRDRDFRADLIEPRALDLYTYDGAVLGYPWALTTGQVFFNRDLFRAAGRATPDELHKQGKWTWDAMTEAAVALTKRGADGKAEQLGLAHMSIWRLGLKSNATDLFDDFRRPKKSRLDEPAAVATLEYVQDVAHKHRGAWKQPEAQDLGGNDLNAYKAGQVAMLVRWGQSHQMEQVAGATAVVPWPKGPDPRGAPVADLTTEAGGILRTSRHQEAAWQFFRWYQKDWQRTVLADRSRPTSARVPSRTDLNEIARPGLPAPQDIWFELVKLGVARPVFPDWNKVNGELINPGLNPVWAAERSPRDAAQAVAKQVNDFLAANPQ
jgi:ABC-type glycerol-3-phosphate transport system substrate-binding protein